MMNANVMSMLSVLQQVVLVGLEKPLSGSAIEAVWLAQKVRAYMEMSAEAWSTRMEAVTDALKSLKSKQDNTHVGAGPGD
jgi:hypothetical protein